METHRFYFLKYVPVTMVEINNLTLGLTLTNDLSKALSFKIKKIRYIFK